MTAYVGPIRGVVHGIYDGPHATPPDSDSGPVFLGIKNLTADGRLDLSEIRHVSEEHYPKWIRRVQPRTNDIVFSYEATLHRYDDLIENNRKRIRLLELAAQLLYREWFLRLRFPGHEHASIKDGVPAGWTIKKISDVCDTIGGGTPSTRIPECWDGNVTWVVPSDVTNNDCLVLLDSDRNISERGLRESSARMVPAGTILMTSRASVGFFALMDRGVATNQGFINIVPHDERLRLYLLFNLMSRVAEIRSNAKGTTYPEISKGRFRAMDIVIPESAIVEKFSGMVFEILRQMLCLKHSAARLAQARDLLLPRLMSRKIAT